MEISRTKGVTIDSVYYYLHRPYGKFEKYKVDNNCRKLKLDMYFEEIKDFDIDISQSYAIGDKI